MHYPILLDVEGRRCVVIGGGDVAERKVRTLLERGARVVVVCAELTPGLEELAGDGKVTNIARPYQSGDLEGARLVFCATDDRVTNALVFAEAEARGIPANVVDDPELCSFIVPSIVARGDLQIAISTGGASPALAKRIRMQLEEEYGPEYERLIEILRIFRARVIEQVASPAARRRIFDAVAESDLLDRIRQGADVTVDDLVKEFAASAQ